MTTRRGFLQRTMAGGALLHLLGRKDGPSPGSADETVIEALAEAIVPGLRSGAGPGAVDGGAVELLREPSLPVKRFLTMASLGVTTYALLLYAKPFPRLDLEERRIVLLRMQRNHPIVVQLYRFIRAAFYADYKSLDGGKWVGYPGPSAVGYVADPDYSIGKPPGVVEITTTGNLA